MPERGVHFSAFFWDPSRLPSPSLLKKSIIYHEETDRTHPADVPVIALLVPGVKK
jgi:hypothetical protein